MECMAVCGVSCKDVCVTMWMCYNPSFFSPSCFLLLPSPPLFPPCQLEVQELKYFPTSETSSEWPDSETHSEVSAEEILEGRREGGEEWREGRGGEEWRGVYWLTSHFVSGAHKLFASHRIVKHTKQQQSLFFFYEMFMLSKGYTIA